MDPFMEPKLKKKKKMKSIYSGVPPWVPPGVVVCAGKSMKFFRCQRGFSSSDARVPRVRG